MSTESIDRKSHNRLKWHIKCEKDNSILLWSPTFTYMYVKLIQLHYAASVKLVKYYFQN